MKTTTQDEWLSPPGSHLLLETGEVHVWRAHLHEEPEQLAVSRSILAPDEREKADRFYFERDRVRFIVARSALRRILSRYLNISPAHIVFSYNQYGKPDLSAAAGEPRLRFNVSHSHERALYAIARGGEVGVDIEFVREDFASLEIAERFFSPREIEMLRRLPEQLRTGAFFNCWTRKEAYIKALGEGLSHPLDKFAVSLAPGEPAALLSHDDHPLEPARWSWVELLSGEGYAAALAFEGELRRLRRWQFGLP
ncbi:MAG TPA: 4'-phosphopantetheinyl transferase superfamily protein [Pyrinomonadaceae bacterium]